MAAFRLTPGFRTYPLETKITPFVEVVGFEALKRRGEQLQKKILDDPNAEMLISHRHMLELVVWDIVKRFRSRGKLPVMYTQETGLDVSLYRAFNFIDLLPDVASHLSPAALKRLKGRIVHAFTDENDLSSVAQELDVISWLSQLGCDITCSDFEGQSGGADFLVERQGIEFEIECKVVTPDKGRQIHQYDAIALYRHLTPVMDAHVVNASPEGVVVTIKIPARLSRNPKTLSEMAALVDQSVKTRTGMVGEHCETIIRTFPIALSPFNGNQPRNDELNRVFLERLIGTRNTRFTMKVSPGRAALVIHLVSERKDEIEDAIYDSIKHASTQLSGTRPGMIAAVFPTVSGDSFDDMIDPVIGIGLEAIIQRLYGGEGREHVCAVHFFGDLGYGVTRSGYFPAPGQIYSSYNESNPSFGDPRLDLGQAEPH